MAIHFKSLQKQMLEIFKILNYLISTYLWDHLNSKQVEYYMRTNNLVVLPVTYDIKRCIDVAAFKRR